MSIGIGAKKDRWFQTAQQRADASVAHSRDPFIFISTSLNASLDFGLDDLLTNLGCGTHSTVATSPIKRNYGLF